MGGNGKMGSSRSAITLKELMTLPLNVVSEDFPGLTSLTEGIERRILIAAKQHFKGKNRKIAQFLKLSDSTTSTRLKSLDRQLASLSKPQNPEVLQ